jgi:Helix-turn-helix domain
MTTSTSNAVPEPGDELLTLPEVAARLRVPMNTLRWWRQRGPGFFKVGRRLVTTTGDLQAWIEEQKRDHGPHAA